MDEARRSEPAPAKAGVLGDKEIVAAIYEALAKRHPQSRTRGRPGTPAEVVLRLLVLKHMRNWSYGVLEREVRANLVYRDFTRVGGAKMPDAKTMGRWGVAVGPAVVKQIHDRMVQIARESQETRGSTDAICRIFRSGKEDCLYVFAIIGGRARKQGPGSAHNNCDWSSRNAQIL